jgi:hypothetical protein
MANFRPPDRARAICGDSKGRYWFLPIVLDRELASAGIAAGAPKRTLQAIWITALKRVQALARRFSI